MAENFDAEKVKFSELYELVVTYAKQQTIDPIRGAGRWLGFGIVGAILMSIGLVIGVLGVLRLIQTTPLGTSNTWSWTSYLITILVCIVIGKFTLSRIKRGTLEK